MSYRKRAESFFAELGSWVFRHRFISLALAAGLIFAMGSQIPKLAFETSVMSMFHEDDPAREANEEFQELFGKDDVFLIVLKPKNIFDAEFLRALAKIHGDLERTVPYVEEITSLANVRLTRGEGEELIVENLMEEVPDTHEAVATFQKRVLESPLYRNLLVSEDGSLTAIVLEPRVTRPPTEAEIQADPSAAPVPTDTPEYAEMYQKILEITEPHRERGIDFYFAGHPVIAVVLLEAMEQDMGRLVPLSMLLMVVLLAAMFRRVTGVVYPFLVALGSVVSTVGAMALLGLPMTNITSGVPNFLVVVSIADSVHILAVFYRRFREDGDKHAAIKCAFGHSGLAVLLTSVTTAAGLLSFVTAEVAWVADYGIAVPIGVLFALVYTFLLLPSLIGILPVRRGREASSDRAPAGDRLLVAIANLALRRKGLVVAIWLTVTAVAAVGFQWTHLTQNSLEWYPDGHPIRVAMETIDDEMKGSLTVEVVLDTGEPDGIYDAELMQSLDRIGAELEQESGGPVAYGKALSVATVIKEVNQALNGNDASFYVVPDDDRLVAQELLLFEMSGSEDLEDQVSADLRKARLSLSVPFADANEYVPLFDHLQSRVAKAFPGQQATVTGMADMFIRAMWNILTSIARSYPIALAVVTILMVLVLGRVRIGLLSMVPNLVPIIIVVGAMGWVGFGFDVSTMIIGAVAIGLVVDDTIHFLHTFAREHGETGDVRLAVERTLLTTGRAILVTSLTLAAGFAVYATATMQMSVRFGILTASIVLIAMLADFLLVPALMAMVFRKQA